MRREVDVVVIKFGANILSQTVQRNLTRATGDLSTTSQRLASGQRINKAADDAAGLAIASSLNVNARIFTQGVRNLNDGLSAVNIAEGAMNELGEIISRIEELASQSVSETYSDRQRAALQKEATALTAEWNRIVESTSFNGQNLLTGASTRTVLQGGVGAEGTLAVQIGEAQLANGLDGYGGTGTTRISTSTAGAQGSAASRVSTISPDGRYVVFSSSASELVSGDTNGVTDLFIRDTVTGETRRVNTDSQGNETTGSSSAGFVSTDGRYVIFGSDATNLVSGDTNGQTDSFLKDMLTGTTTRISTSSSGEQISTGFFVAAVSTDGRYVGFSSSDSTLVDGDTNGQSDAFIKDLVTGRISRVSTNSTGGEATGATSAITALSADGRYVVFESSATNLVAGDTNSANDVFVKDTVTGITTRVSTDSAGVEANTGALGNSRISADGRMVVFSSSSTNLVANDTNASEDVFIKDQATGLTTRVNTTSEGVQAQAAGQTARRLDISADGRFVAFSSSATDLVKGDTNGGVDFFVKDVLSGSLIRVNTDSAGTQGTGSILASSQIRISADGRRAIFTARMANLVAGDTNGQDDVFLRDLTRVGVQQLAGIVVSDKASAKVTLDMAQRYRTELQDYRSKLGATTSRISTFVNTLQSSTINYTAASSRITDADVAEEAAKAIASSIRQQVATALLGQANLAPQIGLKLLRNS